MRALTVEIQNATGRILCSTIFRPCGKKLLAKGHQLTDEDVLLLQNEGLDQVWVTELEEGEVSEDDAVMQIAGAVGCGSVELRAAPGGRANLFTTEPSCILVDDELLRQLNCTASVVIATLTNYSYVAAGVRIATIKSAPFAVPLVQIETLLSMLKERGPLLQARPVRSPSLGVLYSDPANGDKARQQLESVVRQKVERFAGLRRFAATCIEEEIAAAHALEAMLRYRPTAILVASTTAPAGPEDAVGRAMVRIGCHIERFMAPVEPGNLLLLGYKDDTPIVSAPACFRSPRINIVDQVLPPILSQYRVSGWEIACLGHGGLLA
jgi:molybdenum cofactor cytidylyltransferase